MENTGPGAERTDFMRGIRFELSPGLSDWIHMKKSNQRRHHQSEDMVNSVFKYLS